MTPLLNISHRLQSLNLMIKHSYDHIWDTCCDHGYLGQTLLARAAAKTVHFVDVVPALMQQLQHQLSTHYPLNASQDPPPCPPKWQLHCMDATQIKTEPHSRHLIIIAGVGGELLIELMQALASSVQGNTEFLLCPVHHNYPVRQALIKMGFALINESLIKENNRFYEILHVSLQAKLPIHQTGSLMWDFNRAADKQYLSRTIKHYQMKARQANPAFKTILRHYQAVQQSTHTIPKRKIIRHSHE